MTAFFYGLRLGGGVSGLGIECDFLWGLVF